VYGLGRAQYKGQNKEKDYHESIRRRLPTKSGLAMAGQAKRRKHEKNGGNKP
jgi:hypothetical protein